MISLMISSLEPLNEEDKKEMRDAFLKKFFESGYRIVAYWWKKEPVFNFGLFSSDYREKRVYNLLTLTQYDSNNPLNLLKKNGAIMFSQFSSYSKSNLINDVFLKHLKKKVSESPATETIAAFLEISKEDAADCILAAMGSSYGTLLKSLLMTAVSPLLKEAISFILKNINGIVSFEKINSLMTTLGSFALPNIAGILAVAGLCFYFGFIWFQYKKFQTERMLNYVTLLSTLYEMLSAPNFEASLRNRNVLVLALDKRPFYSLLPHNISRENHGAFACFDSFNGLPNAPFFEDLSEYEKRLIRDFAESFKMNMIKSFNH